MEENQIPHYCGPERRAYSRLKIVVFIYSLLEKDKSELAGLVRNISAGGICVIVNRRLEEKTELSIKINFAEEDSPIEVKGEVVWTNMVDAKLGMKRIEYETGIKFTKINGEDRQKIARYILSCSKDYNVNK